MITEINTKHPVTKCIGQTDKGLDLYQIKQPWQVSYKYNGQFRRITACEGYVYDGASIPRACWSLLGLHTGGVMKLPSLPHDIAYRAEGGANIKELRGCTIQNYNGNNIILARKEVDILFREIMKHCYISSRKANLCYTIVRIFGSRHWGGPCPAGELP